MRFVLACFLSLSILPAAEFSTLTSAIRNNDMAQLRKLSADAGLTDSSGNTPLHYAASFGSTDAVEILVRAGADVNARNSRNATPLLYGAWDINRVRLLLAKGANPNVASKDGRTPLMVAAAVPGSLETVRLLLDKGADPKAADQGGATALLLASNAGDAATSRLLLDKGAAVDASDRAGITPLMGAVVANKLETVRLLLSRKANVNAANTFGGKVPAGDIALKQLTPLMLAAPYGSLELVRALVEAGADVNAADVRGFTPFILASATERRNPQVLQYLEQKGAKTDAKTKQGETAADWARKYTQRQMTRDRQDPRPPRAAVESATALLQLASAGFLKGSGCLGCHHQNTASVALNAVRQAGLAHDEKAYDELRRSFGPLQFPFRDGVLERVDLPGGTDMAQSNLMGMYYAGQPSDAITDAITSYIASWQYPDGSWNAAGFARPPIEDSNLSRTAWGVFVLKHYGWPARQPEFEQRIQRARAWLLAQTPVTNYEAADRLLGLHWSGASTGKAAAALLKQQQDNGGWSQNQRLGADAYATGLVLWALRETGNLKPADAAYQRGVAYLCRTQLDDGSWYVASRSPKFQPYFESGFPHGQDQWISAAATAWAVAALAPAAAATSARR